MIIDKNLTFMTKDKSELQKDFKLDYIMINKSPVSGCPYIHIRFYNEDTDTKVQRDYSCSHTAFLSNDVTMGEIVQSLYNRFENDLFAFEELDYLIDETIWELMKNK